MNKTRQVENGLTTGWGAVAASGGKFVRLSTGERIAVFHYGLGFAPNVPVLVMLHGLGAESQFYRRSIEVAGRRCCVFAIDLPGHGESQELRDGATDLVHWNHALQQVMAQLSAAVGFDEITLIGHSLGGKLALMLAATLRDYGYGLGTPDKVRDSLGYIRVKKLVLHAAIVGQTWDDLVAQSWRHPVRVTRLGVAFACADTWRAVQTIRADPHARKAARRNAVRLMWRPLRLAAPICAILRALPSHEHLRQVCEQGISVMVCHGTADRLVPYATAVDTANVVGSAVVSNDDGHCFPLLDGHCGEDWLDAICGAVAQFVAPACEAVALTN